MEGEEEEKEGEEEGMGNQRGTGKPSHFQRETQFFC